MFKLVDIDDMVQVIFHLKDEELDFDDMLKFLYNVKSVDTKHCLCLVNCGECNKYVPREQFCCEWKTHGHKPYDFCSRGTDEAVVKC